MKMCKREAVFLIFLVSVFVFPGCPKKPLVEIERAKEAIEEARKAEAPVYAPDEFRSAENFLEKAMKEMEEGEYPAARASAISAENMAKQALEKALKAKEMAKKEEKVLPETQKFEIPLFEVTGKGSSGEGIVVRELENVYFAFDDYSLSETAKEILKRNAEFLKKYFSQYPDHSLIIEGHCDERGTEEYNIGLGQRRADSVKKYLIALGISPDKIKTVSYGESVPADPGHNEEAWAKNRRAVFVLIQKR